MSLALSIAAASSALPRPIAPRVLKAADLLSFERQGYWLDRGLLDKAQVQALAPALDRVYEQQTHSVLRQKVRVVLGEEALSQAEASGSSLREQTKEFRRRLQSVPDGAIPFLQLFNTWRHSPAVLELLSSPRLASTAAQLLGASGPGQRVRLLQDSLFVKRAGDGETHWHADLAMAPLDTNALVTCWIPLQPVPAESSGGSGLVFAGGSHRDVALPFWWRASPCSPTALTPATTPRPWPWPLPSGPDPGPGPCPLALALDLAPSLWPWPWPWPLPSGPGPGSSSSLEPPRQAW